MRVVLKLTNTKIDTLDIIMDLVKESIIKIHKEREEKNISIDIQKTIDMSPDELFGLFKKLTGVKILIKH